MSKRITTIIGAGAVLDFDYNYAEALVPSTKNITNAIKNLTVQGLDTPSSDVISKVYYIASNSLQQIYSRRNLNINYELNFEELYFLIESMLSFTSNGIEYFTPNGCPPLSTLLVEKNELSTYPYVEYVRALHRIVRKIVEIINKYDTHFRECVDTEPWYRKFWKGAENIKYDIFTFNYDTTIEQSIGNYEDGFVPIDHNTYGIASFRPRQLLRNPNKLSTIQHLHGCIYYSECAPAECAKTHSNRDMFKMNSVQDALSCMGIQQKEQTQAREYFLNSPILIGLRKLDKMTSMPSSIYHADLVNKLMRNNGLLIVGYSFGDLYVNQLMQRRYLMKGEKHKLVIIDYFPQYVDSPIKLYRYMQDNRGQMFQFLKPFLNFRYDDNYNIKGVDFTSYNDPIYSEDHKCMLLICGFKKAIELHSDLIQRFL